MADNQEPKLDFYQLHHYEDGRTRYLLFNTLRLCWGEVPTYLDENTDYYAGFMNSLPQQDLHVSGFFPTYQPNTMLRYDADVSGDKADAKVFIKKQRIVSSSGFLVDEGRFAKLTSGELSVCEILRGKPHANLAEYLGCAVEGIQGIPRVIGIAYTRYSTDLERHGGLSYLQRSDIEPILQAVRQALDHLHSLDIVHCDVRPPNILLQLGSESRQMGGKSQIEHVVLGDFDSAVKVGGVIQLKRAPVQWWPEGVGFGDEATVEVDEHGFSRLRSWMFRQLFE